MTLLPVNASRLQYDLETANRLHDDINLAVQQLKTFKQEPADNLLYWLIWEYGLEDVLLYVPDLRKVIKEGLIWQRLRGTPESLKIALGWIGMDDITIEENRPGRHFYEYQVDPGKIPTQEERSRLFGVADLSAPVRSRLSRMYHGYDVRKLILSEGHFGQFLSDYSGVNHQGTKLSFRRGYQSELAVGQPDVKSSHFRTVVDNAVYEDRPLLSYMYLDDKFDFGIYVHHGRLVSEGLVYDAKPVIKDQHRFSQAAMVLSDSEALGSLHTLLGARRRVELGGTTVLSESKLDDTWQFEWQPVHTLHLDNHPGELDATLPVTASVAEIRLENIFTDSDFRIEQGRTRITVKTPELAGLSWMGRWDQRTWSGAGYTVIGVNFTQTT
ncbi:phage tail protein [Vibrio quintilis]|uniref:Phage tail protein (Tail_P2_I) n=1 Tax=Vibrio quintilis TaxID=1117707 RepID=A0A1M7YZA6_9VIBR|nr:phage tail protein [Vibrio quintilis]SHO57766.1 Phage tail protein (Tail_P2_I) [Vibrio quintilis]